MSRSTNFEIEDLETILKDIVEFLQQFKWLYDFSMIQVMSEYGIVNNLPKEWKDWFAANNYQLDLLWDSLENIDCSSLKKFLLKCKEYNVVSLLQNQCQYFSLDFVISKIVSQKHLQLPTSKPFENEFLPSGGHIIKQKSASKRIEKNSWSVLKKVAAKKKYEIEQLTNFIHALEPISKSYKILDIGSGLGYLDLFLHLNYNYKVLGVEGSSVKVDTALRSKTQYLESDCPDVNFISWFLKNNKETLQKSREIIANFSSSSTNCRCVRKFKSEAQSDAKIGDIILLSLHSCGDLSPIMLKIFAQNSEVSSILMMPCCYHKMTPCATNLKEQHGCQIREKFENFPLSEKLKCIMEKRNFCINTCGLRLASEESLEHWKNRTKDCLASDIASIAYRSILQCVCDKNKITLKKKKRRCAKKSSYSSFQEYVESILNDYLLMLENSNIWTDYELIRSKMLEEYSLKRESIVFVSFVRFLQLSLQPTLESLILIDRLLYLKEKGFQHCGLIKLFEEVNSPRNKAIFSFKD